MSVDLDRTTTGDHTLDQGVVEPPLDDDDVGLVRGRTIGRYVALRRLGSGGMGVVWAAWDPELDREVALKLLSRRYTGATARGRLLREAQAMARVAHPNIVAVHDVGLFEGRVFVAMEFVRGQTLRVWQRERPRGWSEIVDGYRQAARGLGAAHRAGLVHRDFKPDNAMIDGQGRVRVMDFGLAAAHGANSAGWGTADRETDPGEDPASGSNPRSGAAPRTEATGEEVALDRSTGDLLSTPLTEVGALVGTPAYMAPEQLEGARGGPAADQFALCVALWHSLYDQRPFPGQTLHELVVAVSLGRLQAPPAKTEVPIEIQRALERGLELDPARRWPSMEELDAALTVREARTSPWWWVGAVALVAGIVGAGVFSQARQAETCSDELTHFAGSWDAAARLETGAALRDAGPHGDDAWVRVEPIVDGWVERWMAVSSAACLNEDGLPEQLRVAQAICLERRKRGFVASLRLVRDADAEIAARAVDMVTQLPDPRDCSDPERLAALDRRPQSSDPDQAEALRETLAEAIAAREAGRYREAERALQAAHESSEELGDRGLHGELLAELGHSQLELAAYEPAVASFTEAYAALLGAGEDEAAARVAIALIQAFARLADRDQVRAWDLHAGALIERVGASPLLRADRSIALAVAADGAGDYRTALREFEAAAAVFEAELGPDSLRYARMLDELGSVHSRLGELEAAERSQRRALTLVTAALGPKHPEVGTAHFHLGNTAYRRGDLDDARAQFELAIAIVEPALGSANGVVTSSLTGLGAVALGEGRDEDAAKQFRASLSGTEARVGASHPDLVPPLVNLGIALKRAGDYVGAEAAQMRALALLEAQFGSSHPDLLAVLDNLGELRMLAGDQLGAVEAYTRSLAIGEQTFGAGHPELDYALVGLGEAELALGRLDHARVHFDRVLAETESEGKNLGLVAVAEFGVARILEQRGQARDAIARAERARTQLLADERPDPGDLARVEDWLAAHGVTREQ